MGGGGGGSRGENVPMMLLELPEASYVVLHGDVALVEDGADGAIDLDAVLDSRAPAAGAARCLRIELDGVAVRCRTRARLQILELPARGLFHLPWVLRASGCAPWVRGFAVLANVENGAAERPLGLWVDLRALVKDAGHGTTAA